MGDYLKLFKTHSEYETYSGGEMLKPNVSYCRQENEVHYNPFHDYSQDYLTFVAEEAGTFTFTPKNNNVISYSTDDGESWTTGSSVTVNSDDKVLWKGTMTPIGSGIGNFSSSGNFDVQGNVMSLLYGDNFKGEVDLTGKNYVFYQLFYNAKVLSAENLSLPATTLANSCYSNMFRGCTALTTAPELPATTLLYSCYNSMFRDCTSLTTAPELPATTAADTCYLSMFQGCTSLTTAPELPANWLGGEGNYANMFRDCTSLTTAPSILPVTRLVSGCYHAMFQGCTSLVTAPELPATTLASQCYGEMFNGCTSLNYIKAMFTTTPGSSYTSDWVSGVSSTGTFVKNDAATWNVSGNNGIPTGWTVKTASA